MLLWICWMHGKPHCNGRQHLLWCPGVCFTEELSYSLVSNIIVICFTISQNAQNISTNICMQYNVLACSVLSHYKFYSDCRWRMLLLCFVRFGWWVLRPWVGPEFHICLASALTPAAYQNAAHLYGSPTLTHWGWSVIKMATISQTTFANTFSWMRM